MMTDEEALAFYDKLVEYYGDKLADPIHHPIAFAHQVKVYRYYNTHTTQAVPAEQESET
jgi:hypothetical protein